MNDTFYASGDKVIRKVDGSLHCDDRGLEIGCHQRCRGAFDSPYELDLPLLGSFPRCGIDHLSERSGAEQVCSQTYGWFLG